MSKNRTLILRDKSEPGLKPELFNGFKSEAESVSLKGQVTIGKRTLVSFLGVTSLDEFCKKTLNTMEEVGRKLQSTHKFIWAEGFCKLMPKKTEPEAVFMFVVRKGSQEWK